MLESLQTFDATLLSRIQFGFTITFHILFPALSIGLAGFLVVLEALWLRTGEERYWRLLRFWTTVFALSFGMGVVSGIVLAYQFGTNWSGLMAKAGQILGPLLSYETLTAFFLEASFLGVLLFGWKRVSRRTHFISTVMVALGTCISAFWIMASNSWMQTPAGFTVRDGVFYPADWWAIIFNPSFLVRYAHMLMAAYLASAFVVAGVAAWYLLNNRFVPLARPMLALSFVMIVPLAPLQVIIGDMAGLIVRDYQPAKLAAMEAQWETGVMPLRLFAIPNQQAARNDFEIGIPKLGSLITQHSLDAPVKGLREFPPAERPNAAIIFWTFRVMVGIGFLMLAIALTASILAWRKKLFTSRWFLRALTFASPLGFVAIVAGWYTAEICRQPYVIYGLLRTADAVSPVTTG
ncbi:MAG: cytochrome ubiquinol oxidase subunit I, partial [Pseudomonadota bacterium]|nr:cytochrome ubiquinol oxidase subunit I [Pseudomonadota bacterium]